MAPYISKRVLQTAPLASLDLRTLKILRDWFIGSRTHKAESVARGRVIEMLDLLENSETDVEVKSVLGVMIGSLAQNTQASTVLALCRGNAVAILFKVLGEYAHPLAQAFSANDQRTLASLLALVESCVRALKQILSALAHIASPNVNRTVQDAASSTSLATPRTSGSGSSSPLVGASGTSSREVVGWHLADVGFLDDTGRLKTRAPMPAVVGTTDKLTPERELILRAREVIDFAFEPPNLRLWVGALFMARIRRHSSDRGLHSGRATASNSRVASAVQSRSSTRPVSPAFGGSTPLYTSSANSRTSSRMSMGSDLQRSSLLSGMEGFSRQGEHVRVFKIYELVLEALADVLAIPSSGVATNPKRDTPIIILERRRRAITSLTARDSPYWGPATGDRGRDADSKLEGSFVRRGNSTDGRQSSPAGDSTVGMALDIEADSSTVDASKTVLDVIVDAIHSGRTKIQANSLFALSELCRDSLSISRMLVALQDEEGGEAPTSTILHLRTHTSVSLRLAALCCLVNILKIVPFTSTTDEFILKALIDLSEISGFVQVRSLAALSILLTDNTALQSAASKLGCIEKFSEFLLQTKAVAQMSPDSHSAIDFGNFGSPTTEEYQECLREASLRVLGALCFQHDDIRRSFVDQNVVGSPTPMMLAVQSLSASRVGVRVAACAMVRALSRSVGILRTSLVDAGVVGKLMALLQNDGEAKEVKTEVLAALCNLVLKFSPVRESLIEGDALGHVASLLADGTDGMLRLNALWVVRNSTYCASAAHKEQIMKAIGWSILHKETRSADLDMQCESLGILRNLTNNTNGSDVQLTLDGFGGAEALFETLERVIWQRKSQDCIEQAAYILVNIASSSDAHRALILDRSNLLDALVFFLNFPRPGVRVAGIWAIHNLTQSSAGSAVPLPEAVMRLLRFSFNVRLQELVDDPERDVSDRARSLLQRLSPLASS